MIKKILYSTLIVVTAFVAFSYLCLTTTAGSKLLFKVIRFSMPGQMTVKQIQGNLRSGLTLEQFSYKTKTMTISMDELNSAIRITALLDRTIAFDHLTVKKLRIIDQSNHKKSPTKSSTALLPFHLSISQAELTDSLYQHGNKQWSLQQLNLNQQSPTKKNINTVELTWQHAAWQTANLTQLTSHHGSAIIKTQGKINKKHINIELQQLSGQWQEQDLSGHGGIIIKNNTVSLQHIIINVGKAQLSLNGCVGDKWQLTWSTSIPELANILPKANGKIQSHGKLTGKRLSPQIDAHLLIEHLKLTQVKINQLAIKIKPSNILLMTGNNITIGNWQLVQTHIKIKEKNKQHTAHIFAKTPMSNLDILLTGTTQGKYWPVWLKQVNFSSKDHGMWRLDNTARFIASAHDIVFEPFCLKSDKKTSICTQAYWKPHKEWLAHIQTKALPLTDLLSSTQQNPRLQGNLSFDLQLAQIANKFSGNATASLSSGSFNNAFTEERNKLTWQSGYWKGKIDKNGVKSSFKLTIADDSIITGKLLLPKLKDLSFDLKQQPMQSSIQANLTQLAFLSLIFPEISDVKGHLSANWQITGTIDSPSVKGTTKLTQASCQIPRAGITLEDIVFNISSPTLTQINYAGSMRANKGTLSIKGKTSLAIPDFPTELRLTGQNALIFNNTTAKLTVDPDLQLTIQNHSTDLSGKIHIPTAIITPKDSSNSVTLSDDVIFVSDLDENTPKMHFSSQLDLTLGDNVFLNYAGLNAHLGGSVSLSESSSQATTAVGELYVKKGFYNAYGRQLNISQGQLMFAGGPVTNPAINIKASKEVATISQSSVSNTNYTSNTVVGVSLTGTLKKPQMTLFSEPSGLSQSQILSNLVMGTSLDKVTGQEKKLTKALSSSNVNESQAAMLKEQLQHSLGLDELSVTSGDVYDPNKQSVIQNTSLTLGKMLSPRLYMNYSVGLITSTNIFSINYKINNKWRLRSQTDLDANAIDLIYSIDKD